MYQHEEVLRHFCDLLKDTNYEVIIYSSAFVHAAVQPGQKEGNFDWKVKSEEQSISQFLDFHLSEIKKNDFVLICTALNSFKAFAKLIKQTNSHLIVHNAHSWLTPENHVQLGLKEPIKDRFRFLKIRLNWDHFYKTEIIENIKSLVFPTKMILKYVQTNFSQLKNKVIGFQEFSYYQNSEKKGEKTINICIPGTVLPEIRDYQSVLTALCNLEVEASKKINLVLLGKYHPNELALIDKFKKQAATNIKTHSFDHYIPNKEYQHWLRKADLLLLPLIKKVKNHIYLEEVGNSKISGGMNDMIRHGTLSLIPSEISIDSELSGLVIKYQENELGAKLKECLENLNELKEEASKNRGLQNRNYTEVKSRFLKFIESNLP